jgi:hypothetical protein
LSKPAAASKWEYSKGDRDKMRGTVTEYATLVSGTVLRFEFPFNGGSVPKLMLMRTVGKNETSILLRVSKGKFDCIDGCRVNYKFDDGKVGSLMGMGSVEAGEGDLILLRFVESNLAAAAARTQQIPARMKKSQRLILEAPFYGEGRQQMEFSTAGLKW